MKFVKQQPGRRFEVGKSKIVLTDTGSIFLEPDEQVTFKDSDGGEYDVCRKVWGYYATPSVDGRLSQFGFSTALVQNVSTELTYVMLVKKAQKKLFFEYLEREGLKVVQWLSE